MAVSLSIISTGVFSRLDPAMGFYETNGSRPKYSDCFRALLVMHFLVGYDRSWSLFALCFHQKRHQKAVDHLNIIAASRVKQELTANRLT